MWSLCSPLSRPQSMQRLLLQNPSTRPPYFRQGASREFYLLWDGTYAISWQLCPLRRRLSPLPGVVRGGATAVWVWSAAKVPPTASIQFSIEKPSYGQVSFICKIHHSPSSLAISGSIQSVRLWIQILILFQVSVVSCSKQCVNIFLLSWSFYLHLTLHFLVQYKTTYHINW